jgi:hypothetical protein
MCPDGCGGPLESTTLSAYSLSTGQQVMQVMSAVVTGRIRAYSMTAAAGGGTGYLTQAQLSGHGPSSCSRGLRRDLCRPGPAPILNPVDHDDR